ncbi:hypothetical protein V6N13_049165 [Hibiscus sabdariffa]
MSFHSAVGFHAKQVLFVNRSPSSIWLRHFFLPVQVLAVMDHSLCLLRNSVDAAAVSNENDANASSSSNKLSLGVDTTLKTRIAKVRVDY